MSNVTNKQTNKNPSKELVVHFGNFYFTFLKLTNNHRTYRGKRSIRVNHVFPFRIVMLGDSGGWEQHTCDDFAT